MFEFLLLEFPTSQYLAIEQVFFFSYYYYYYFILVFLNKHVINQVWEPLWSSYLEGVIIFHRISTSPLSLINISWSQIHNSHTLALALIRSLKHHNPKTRRNMVSKNFKFFNNINCNFFFLCYIFLRWKMTLKQSGLNVPLKCSNFTMYPQIWRA